MTDLPDLQRRADELVEPLVPRLAAVSQDRRRPVTFRAPSRARLWYFAPRQQFLRSTRRVTVVSNPRSLPVNRLWRSATERELRVFVEYDAGFVAESLAWIAEVGHPPGMDDIADRDELLSHVVMLAEPILDLAGLRRMMTASGPSGVRYRILSSRDARHPFVLGASVGRRPTVVYNPGPVTNPLFVPATPGLLRYFVKDAAALWHAFSERAARRTGRS